MHLTPLLIVAALAIALHDTAVLRPDAERWIVVFESSDGRLDPLRAAIHADNAPGVKTRVAELEAEVTHRRLEFVALIEGLGGRVDRSWWLIDACAVEIPPDRAAVLANHPTVRSIHPDRLWHACSALPIKTSTDAQNHNADFAQSLGFSASNVTLACLDSGQDSAHGLLPRPHRIYFIDGNLTNLAGGGLAGSRLLANIQLGAMTPDDITGHGTAMAAIAAGGNWGTAAADNGHAPHAQIVGYSIADTISGQALSSTLISAWQRVVTDKVTYGIDVVLNSYAGSPNPLDPVQQALDSAVVTADILVSVPGGNSGATTTTSQSAANGIAVAACGSNRVIDSNSSRGPLQGDTARTYPDITANGVSIVTAERDNESVNRIEQGTSAASAQVAGAALLYRSIKPNASALETKAAILATTEDISAQNAVAPFNSPNAYGTGYLRDDALIDIALGQAFVANASLGYSKRSLTYRVGFAPGVIHRAALVWHRHDVSSTQWSDFNLVVRDGSTVLASSTSSRNLYETLSFVATNSVLEIDIEGDDLECPKIDFSVVIPGGKGSVPTTQNAFGPGCKGNCPRVNPDGDKLSGVIVTQPRIYAIQAQTTTAVTTDGFWICALSAVGTSINASLWTSKSTINGLEPDQVVDQGLISIPPDTTPAWHQVQFASTQQLTASTTYFVQFEANSLMVLPDLIAGPSTLHVEKNLNATAWTHSNAIWAYRLFCPDAIGDVEIGFKQLPYVGLPFTITLDYGRALSLVSLSLGFSSTNSGGLPLPFDLGLIGAPTCKVYTSLAIVAPALTNAAGHAESTIPLPPNPGLAGLTFYNQWFCFDAGANSLGLVTSSSLESRIGSSL